MIIRNLELPPARHKVNILRGTERAVFVYTSDLRQEALAEKLAALLREGWSIEADPADEEPTK